MESKIIEIRDSGTFIPALAVRLGSSDERERYLLARSGFGLLACDGDAWSTLQQRIFDVKPVKIPKGIIYLTPARELCTIESWRQST